MDEFSTRLKKLLEYLNITPVSLAEKMGVQRTSFNHLLSGRNKPGFEFLTKLHTSYPSINLNWLISGHGSITMDTVDKISSIEKNELESPTSIDLSSNIFNTPKKEILLPEIENLPIGGSKDPINDVVEQSSNEASVDRILIVYSNGKMVEIKEK